MTSIVHLDSRACPRCGLRLRIARGENAVVMRYDMTSWARQCIRADSDGPSNCPWVGPLVRALPSQHQEALDPAANQDVAAGADKGDATTGSGAFGR